MSTKYDFIFFDVANTLLHKPSLFEKLSEAFERHNYNYELSEIRNKHKLLSEVIKFPDKTSLEFYTFFNAELCMSLGAIPSESLLHDMFSNCSYLPWEPFDDVVALNKLEIPIGIISNWDEKLKSMLSSKINIEFDPIIGSNYEGVCKPDIRIFENAWNKLGKDKKKILYVGDSIKLDMLPALEIGWDVCLIDRDNLFSNFPFRTDSLMNLKTKLL
ncbi:HAD family hydrolase [Crocinitomix catalasitica]|uniref:HAD family hydrolase n=1 Tax=Crocinitomix catalasitica TaxID=184607 RepID=UPI00048631EA|nr:HAD family hydrolase [Crocinitomix catalasitica]